MLFHGWWDLDRPSRTVLWYCKKPILTCRQMYACKTMNLLMTMSSMFVVFDAHDVTVCLLSAGSEITY